MTAQSVPAGDEYARAALFARSAQLNDVMLRALDASLGVDRNEALRMLPWQAELTHEAKFFHDIPKKILCVEAMLTATVRAEAGKPRQVLSVRTILALEYTISGDSPTDDLEASLGAFARINGIYNAWPYFREVVQSTVSRMGLPPLVIPVYRVPSPSRRSTDTPPARRLSGPKMNKRSATARKPPRSAKPHSD